MANDPGEFQNPKIHDTGTKSSGGIGKWIGIALAAVLVLLLLWLFGALGGDDADDVAVDTTDSEVVTVPTN